MMLISTTNIALEMHPVSLAGAIVCDQFQLCKFKSFSSVCVSQLREVIFDIKFPVAVV